MPDDFKITTELLYRSALVFALVDAVYIPLLIWRVREETFRLLKWTLVIAAALIWLGIWSWAIGNFWETVYSYVFPAWAQKWTPWIAFIAAGLLAWIAFIAAGLLAWIVWTLAIQTKAKVVPVYCLLGGILGSLTHAWAVTRGIVTKPPMLQGASPLGAVTIAFFEYIFYWCVILTLAAFVDWLLNKLRKRSS